MMHRSAKLAHSTVRAPLPSSSCMERLEMQLVPTAGQLQSGPLKQAERHLHHVKGPRDIREKSTRSLDSTPCMGDCHIDGYMECRPVAARGLAERLQTS
jgi:hypothetical protein